MSMGKFQACFTSMETIYSRRTGRYTAQGRSHRQHLDRVSGHGQDKGQAHVMQKGKNGAWGGPWWIAV